MRERSGKASKRTKTRLWVGGSSGLAETFFSNLDAFVAVAPKKVNGQQPTAVHWILVGMERSGPPWIPTTSETESFDYRQCDLTQMASIQRLIQELPDSIDQIILSVRPPLVTHRTDQQAFRYAQVLVKGFATLLTWLVQERKNPPSLVLHVSSIAAIDHLHRQRLRSETSEPDPSSSDLRFPYDWFKRKCEEKVEEICCGQAALGSLVSSDATTAYTNLRFGAIFSDAKSCIQCSALALQAVLGPYLMTPIDCNSSWNAALLIHQILNQNPTERRSLRPVYYYTRPLQLSKPIPYGEYLVAYRQAYHLTCALWIPNWVVHVFVSLIHGLAGVLGSVVPYLQSVDYLLQVTRHEHTFDLSAVRHDFGEGLIEESILACFQRRRNRRLGLCKQLPPLAALQPKKSC